MIKQNTVPPPVTAKSTNHVHLLLVALCVLCGALAVIFNYQKKEVEEQLSKVQRKLGSSKVGAQSSDDATTAGSEQVYKHVDLLAQKDAIINELRQLNIALKEGRAPDTKLSPGTLPKSVRTTRPKKTPERPAEVPRPEPIRSIQPATTAPTPVYPVYPNLAEQESFLRELDTSSLSDNEAAVHKELLKHIQALRRLAGNLEKARGADPTGQLRPALTREEQAVVELMQQERQALFSNMGRELGYNDESSLLFADYIERVDSMTTLRPAAKTSPAMQPAPEDLPVTSGQDAEPVPPPPGQ